MSHIRSPGALIFALICLTGTMIVLFGHVRSFDDLTINHLYIVLALTVTLGSAHFMWDAYAAGYMGVPRGVSFTLLFIVGTVVCVGLSGGRSAAILAARDFDAQQVATSIKAQQAIVASALKDKDAAQQLYDDAMHAVTIAEQLATDECATGKNAGKGSKCDGKRLSLNDARASSETLYERLNQSKSVYNSALSTLNAIKPAPPPNTDLKPFAMLYALITHTSEDQALDVVKTLLPYAFAIITEFGTVAFFQHAFGSAPPPIAPAPTVTLVEIASSLGMKSDEARKVVRTLKIPKPSQGWVFSPADAAKIKAQLQSHHP